MVVASALACVVGAFSCVDLFHTAEFDTLCSDAAADGCATNTTSTTDAQVDAAVVRMEFCAWSSVEAAQHAQRACAWLGACEGPLGASAFGPCALHAQLAYDCTANPSLRPNGAATRYWTCLAQVKTCADVDACVFPSGKVECSEIASGTFTACGDNDNKSVRVRCGTGKTPLAVEPCLTVGETCTKDESGPAACTGSQGGSCTKSRCEGSNAVSCSALSTQDRGLDCANYGNGKCMASEDGGVPLCAAADDAPSCDKEAPPACVGSVVKSCVDRREIQVDCSSLGLPCDDTRGVLAHDPASACVRRTGTSMCNTPDSCDGDTISSCAQGGSFVGDCKAYGLGACKLVDGLAACTKP
jgi:hypothetical protein